MAFARGTAHEADWPVAGLCQEARRDLLIIGGKVALGDAMLPKQDAIRMGDGDVVPGYLK